MGPPVKPLPTERGEITDSTSTPAVTEPESVETVEELSDTEAAEKENIENFEESSQKAEAARVRVANKVKLDYLKHNITCVSCEDSSPDGICRFE